MITKQDLLNKNLELIPVQDLEITLDPNETTGYDLTVEDYYTFASHDGVFVQDTMAIYHPITNESQAEIQSKMMRGESGESDTSVTFELSKEMCVGLYLITKDVKKAQSPIQVFDKDLETAIDPYIPVKYRENITTMGKAIFNSALPLNFPFMQQQITKKIVNNLIPEMLKKYGLEQTIKTFSAFEKIGFKFSTIIAPSITLDDIELPSSILQLKKKLDSASTEEASVLLKEMQKLLIEHLKNTGLYDLVESGAGKGWTQPMQILVAKGLIADPTGKILPTIKGSFADGLSNTEYFTAAAGARKGIIDRVLNTADTGYMSRQLAYVLNSVEIDHHLKDCKTKRYLSFRMTKDMLGKFTGRYVVKGNSIEKFDPKEIKVGDVVNLRTPIFCESPKLCHTCYGELLNRHKSPYAGIIAAQLVGEAGTQTVMKCSDGLVHYNGNLIPFVDLFEMGSNYRKIENLEIVDFNKKIRGKDGFVESSTIQKHMPNDKLLFISTSCGHTLICQANHPLWVKKNNLHKIYENRFCNLIGNDIYTEYKGGRKSYKTDHELKEIYANELKKYDCIWVDNSDAIYNENNILPNVSGYIAGIYFAEGSKTGNDRRIKQNRISQITEGPIKTRIYNECKNEFRGEEEKVTYTIQGINIWDNSRRINKVVLGSYAWEKRLKYDFINYDKNWLKEFLSGVIDGDGSVFTHTSTCCRIYTTSYYFVQQLNAICLKLGYKFNCCLGSYSKKFGRIRVYFQCDIEFYENPKLSSEKFNSVNFVPMKYNRNKKPIRGFDKITTIKELPLDSWNYPLYDIKTKTSEYLLGFVQNHNTFHTGGAIKLFKRDIKYDILQNDPLTSQQIISKHLEQNDNELFTKENMVMTLVLDDYPLTNDLVYNDEKTEIMAKALVCKVEYDDAIFNIVLDYPVTLKVYEEERIGKELLKLYYEKDSTILDVPLQTEEISQQIQYVRRLLGGHEIYKDANHLFLKLFSIYGTLRAMDSVHLEVLLSQALRDKRNQSIPARLGRTWDPVMINIKQIVFKTSFIQGLAFENIGEAIRTGLITEEGGEPSILEKVLTGTLVETKKR